jgi:hypothetical protein
MLAPGFPLDDAWIHQTYARTLIQEGEWAFIPGQSSAGSTSPLWTILLALGYILALDPRFWAYLLGFICLFAIVLVCLRWFHSKQEKQTNWGLFLSVMIAFEWHLLWSGLSGMEIPLFSFLVCSILFLGLPEGWHQGWIGFLVGVGIWIRPDALTLLLPVLWILFWQERGDMKSFFTRGFQFSVGMGLVLLPYLYFNYQLSGEILPTTFYAKQIEYGSLRSVSFLTRWLRMSGLPITDGAGPFVEIGGPLIGVLSILSPGILYGAWLSIRLKRWKEFAPLLWVLGFLTLYAIRLPATYQHGRYMMPTIPVLLTLAVLGMQQGLQRLDHDRRGWILQRVWVLSSILISIGFLLRGAQTYGKDVAIIESEMVATARWVNENIEMDAVIAAHDIGAIGYFATRDLVDLAGLVSPEVVPILRDEKALAGYLNEQQVDYLVAFPNWYGSLTRGLEQVYQSSGDYSVALGGENMVVYRWK